MKLTKTINLQATSKNSDPSRAKSVSHDKVIAVDAFGDEALLDTDEDKILHLHDSIVGEDKLQHNHNRR